LFLKVLIIIAKTSSISQLHEIQELIKTLWDIGFSIRTVSHANSEWIVVADEPETKVIQQLFISVAIPEKEISDAIANNKAIQFLGFCNSYWILLIEQKPRPEKFYQKLKTFRDGADIVIECERIWAEGLVVSHLAAGNGDWIIIASDKSDPYMHWTQEAVLIKRPNWSKQLFENTGASNPSKIKNLLSFELCDDHGILLNWVKSQKNVVWDVPTILLTQTMPISKWNELGGKLYKDGQFYTQQ